MAVKGSHLSWIVVADIQKARKFFSEVLGMKENSFDAQYKWAEFEGKEGGSMVGIAEMDASIPAGSNAVITFTVDNIEDSKKEFESKKVKVIGDIMEVPGHVKLLLFADSDGNHFQLAQMLE